MNETAEEIAELEERIERLRADPLSADPIEHGVVMLMMLRAMSLLLKSMGRYEEAKEYLDLQKAMYAEAFKNDDDVDDALLDQLVDKQMKRTERWHSCDAEGDSYMANELKDQIEHTDCIAFDPNNEIGLRDLLNDGQLVDEEEGEAEYLEQLGMQAVDALRELADFQQGAGKYEEAALNRRRAVELCCETLGEFDTWTVHMLVNGQKLMEDYASVLKRLARHEELEELNEKLSTVNKLLDDNGR